MHKITKDDIDWARRVGFQQKARLPSCVLLSHEDCAQAACVGLCTAAVRFDDSRGIPFKSFAYFAVAGAVITDLRQLEGGSNYTKQKFEVHSDYLEEPTKDIPSLAGYELDLLAKRVHLSTGEYQVLQGIQAGLNISEIAASIGTSSASVHNQKLRIRRKLAKVARVAA